MEQKLNDFNLLAQRPIIDILIGDAPLDDDDGAKMPYQSGPMLVGLLNKYGAPTEYGPGAKSRWVYMEELLKRSIASGAVQNLLAEFFSLDHFAKELAGMPANRVRVEHQRIVALAIEKINGVLLFGGKELVVAGKSFTIREIGSKVTIAAPAIKRIDREYVRDISQRASLDVENGDYDSALTKSRTLLEESFCYVIELAGESPEAKGDIGKLFKQVRNLYNMHAGPEVDSRINEIVSGLNKTVSGIGDLRNAQGDAHGVGSKRMAISNYHAQLAVNASSTVAEFVLQVAANKSQSA